MTQAPTFPRSRGNRLPVLGMTVWLWACGPSGATAPPEPTPVDTTPSEPAPPSQALCGEPGLGFEEHAWAPADASAVASIRLDDPELSASLSALGEFTRGTDHGLPIPLALSLGQWSWQVPLLVATLHDAGFEPAELTFVASDDAAHAWVVRSTCDLDEAIERMEDAWGVQTRRSVDGVVGTAPPPTDDTPAFPYDVLLLPGDRLALVPAGRGLSALARFGRPAPTRGLGVTAPQTAGRRVDVLPPAPVRLVVLGLSLVAPTEGHTPGDARGLRVDAQGVTEATPSSEPASVGDPS